MDTALCKLTCLICFNCYLFFVCFWRGGAINHPAYPPSPPTATVSYLAWQPECQQRWISSWSSPSLYSCSSSCRHCSPSPSSPPRPPWSSCPPRPLWLSSPGPTSYPWGSSPPPSVHPSHLLSPSPLAWFCLTEWTASQTDCSSSSPSLYTRYEWDKCTKI